MCKFSVSIKLYGGYYGGAGCGGGLMRITLNEAVSWIFQIKIRLELLFLHYFLFDPICFKIKYEVFRNLGSMLH